MKAKTSRKVFEYITYEAENEAEKAILSRILEKYPSCHEISSPNLFINHPDDRNREAVGTIVIPRVAC